MRSFDEHFTDTALIQVLARIRVKGAARRHDALFFAGLGDSSATRHVSADVDRIFPPRKLWRRPGRKAREHAASSDVWIKALTNTTRALYPSAIQQRRDWALRLSSLLEATRARASDPHAPPPAFRIQPTRKSASDPYRPIASYVDLSDRLIASQTARYLREAFDQDFLPSALAFRTARNGLPSPTHHDAIRGVLAFRSVLTEAPYVAECDLRSFFDCINHHVAWTSYLAAHQRAAERGLTIDPRATAVFLATLRAYTFFGTAAPQAEEWIAKHGAAGKLKSPLEVLRRLYADPTKERVGVPQGGAISCLIANLVLHFADRAVEDVLRAAARRGYYARYCDDMIVITEDRSICEQALEAYTKVTEDLLLPIHAAKAACTYGKAHWSAKSKAPYKWSSVAAQGVPWVAFVGYQIRFDGAVRVRKASIEKEMNKQARVVEMAIGAIERGLSHPSGGKRRAQLSIREALFRINQRLIAMSVGRHCETTNRHLLGSGSWKDGFGELRGRPIASSQLRELDRSRGRQLRKAARLLAKKLPMLSPSRDEKGVQPTFRAHYGAPYSYAYSLRPHSE